jgi:hypothetical protein
MPVHRREVYSIVTIERNFVSRPNSRFRYVEETSQELYQIWYGILHEGARAGLFRKDLNMHLTLRIIMDAINSTVRWYRPGGRYTIEEIIENHTRLLLDGLDAR